MRFMNPEKVKATRAKVVMSIIKLIEAKVSTAELFGLTDVRATLARCLEELRADPLSRSE